MAAAAEATAAADARAAEAAAAAEAAVAKAAAISPPDGPAARRRSSLPKVPAGWGASKKGMPTYVQTHRGEEIAVGDKIAPFTRGGGKLEDGSPLPDSCDELVGGSVAALPTARQVKESLPRE